MTDNALAPIPGEGASDLCLECGLCCDGTLFGYVPLHAGDRDSQVDALASTDSSEGVRRLTQPCPALDGRCCTVYSARPTVCRSFQCKLLVRLNTGAIGQAEALAVVRSTRGLVQGIRRELERRDIDVKKRTLLAACRDLPHWPGPAALGPLILPLRKLAWNLHEYFNERAAQLLSGQRPPNAGLHSMGDPPGDAG